MKNLNETTMNKPFDSNFKKQSYELLLPVGNKDMALAAIHNGADAIYIGTPKFNARGRSYDFQISELKEIIDLCHLYGVKVHLALNIVIFENEIQSIKDLLTEIIPLGPDSFIIQDLGLVQIIRSINPNQRIHGSTQMTITNDLAISLLDDLNIQRFVLGRENSISEIKLIKSKTLKELEVFVHGALCVSYSGQCFTSETLGGRSANRGQCAQSCRFSYEMYVDGELHPAKNKDYLVSPKDLCGINEIPELMSIGVESFKVEGRLKSPEYVASAASSYRKKINSVLHSSSTNSSTFEFSPLDFKYHNDISAMQIQYSRGFFSGWLHGVNHQQLVNGTFSSHRGLLIGKIIGVLPTTSEITVELYNEIELKNGDGLLWSNNLKSKSDTGSFIFSVDYIHPRKVNLGVSKNLELSRTIIGVEIYLNHDKELKNELQKSYSHREQFKKIKVQYHIEIQENSPLKITLTDGEHTVEGSTLETLKVAQNKPLTEQILLEELSSLGGTVFKIDKYTIQWIGENKNLFIPHKSIKNLRQNLCEALTNLRIKNKNSQPLESTSSAFIVEKSTPQKLSKPNDLAKNSIQFHLLLRDITQIKEVSQAITNNNLNASDIHSILLDFEFGRDYREALDIIRSHQIKSGIATTRILKPQEYNNLKIIFNLNPDIILVRNLGALYYFTNIQKTNAELRGDFSLNVTNHYTADYLLSKGLNSICASYDMNQTQLSDLLNNISSTKSLEVTVHQSMPSFHMEHCVFAAFLSEGTSYRDCGKPCEKHTVQMKDQFGNWHWIKPDQECRNTMYNAKSQTAAKYIEQWIKMGLGHLRFEALNEAGEELISKISNYIRLIKNPELYNEISPLLSSLEKYGLDEGSLQRQHQYQSRKKTNSYSL